MRTLPSSPTSARNWMEFPLAIEFAAARVDAFGVRGVASRLDDRLRLLTSGRSTALPRHQTMRATLDWSYEFLPELERLLLATSGHLRWCLFTGGGEGGDGEQR